MPCSMQHGYLVAVIGCIASKIAVVVLQITVGA